MEEISKPAFKLLYDSKDISVDISKYLISIEYKDNTEGKSDEIDICIEDGGNAWQGIQGFWKNEWYPEKGAKLTLSMGYNNNLAPCGVFQIDEIAFSGPPDVVNIRALAVGVSGTLRTKKTFAHENKTLQQIAQAVARANSLTLEGTIQNITFKRITQNKETDLAFLNRISVEYGYYFSVRDTKLIFTDIAELENFEPVATLDRTDLIIYSITDKSGGQTYSSARVKYSNPVGGLVDFIVEAKDNKDNVPFNYIKVVDQLVINTKAENKQQAEAKAKAALRRANSLQQEGHLTAQGNPYLVAGNNFELTGLGKLSGIFHIMASIHRQTKGGGYTVDLDIKRVGFLLKVKNPPKKKRKPNYTIKVIT